MQSGQHDICAWFTCWLQGAKLACHSWEDWHASVKNLIASEGTGWLHVLAPLQRSSRCLSGDMLNTPCAHGCTDEQPHWGQRLWPVPSRGQNWTMLNLASLKWRQTTINQLHCCSRQVSTSVRNPLYTLQPSIAALEYMYFQNVKPLFNTVSFFHICNSGSLVFLYTIMHHDDMQQHMMIPLEIFTRKSIPATAATGRGWELTHPFTLPGFRIQKTFQNTTRQDRSIQSTSNPKSNRCSPSIHPARRVAFALCFRC